MQRELEGISESLRIPGNKSLGPVAKVNMRPNLHFNTVNVQEDLYVVHGAVTNT